MIHKSAKSCVALNLLKPTGFSEGFEFISHQKQSMHEVLPR